MTCTPQNWFRCSTLKAIHLKEMELWCQTDQISIYRNVFILIYKDTEIMTFKFESKQPFIFFYLIWDISLCFSRRFLWVSRGSSVMKRTVCLRTTWIWMMNYKHQQHESNINQHKPTVTGTSSCFFIYFTSRRPPRFEDLV